MARPWRNDTEQLQYEEQLPDRFDPGSDWIAIASRARDMPSARRYTAQEWETLTGQRIGAPGATIIAAGLYQLRPDYETARLRARHISVEGAAIVRRALDDAAVAIREHTDPEAIARHHAPIVILQQALADPDRRLPFSRLITTLNLQPRTVTPRNPRR